MVGRLELIGRWQLLSRRMAARLPATILSAGRFILVWLNFRVCDSPAANARIAMEVGKFFDLCELAPVRSFQVFLSDGRNFTVGHPDYIAVDGGAATVTICEETSNFAEVIDIGSVVSVRHEVAS